jgi:hypothetical protein
VASTAAPLTDGTVRQVRRECLAHLVFALSGGELGEPTLHMVGEVRAQFALDHALTSSNAARV